jgi:hypothetical protein
VDTQDTLQGSQDTIQRHVAGTYRSLRLGMFFVALVFPLYLWPVGALWYGIPWQGSLSAYYHAVPPADSGGGLRAMLAQSDLGVVRSVFSFLGQPEPAAPMRTWFVGTLFLLGGLLVLYQGFSWKENWLLNAAGVFSVGVALLPMEWPCAGRPCAGSPLHGVCAYAGFLCIGLVAIRLSQETLSIEGLDPQQATRYRRWYRVTGWGMIAVPVTFGLLALLLGLEGQLTYVAEWGGLWAFAAYWFIKSRELAENRAEILAVQGRLAVAPSAVPRAGAPAGAGAPRAPGGAPPARRAPGPTLRFPGLGLQPRRLMKVAPTDAP